MRTLINWKVYFILLMAAILSSLALLPYALERQPGTSLTLEMIAQTIIGSGLQFSILILLGMILMTRTGLSAPVLDSLTKGAPVSIPLRRILRPSITLGVVAALIVIGLEILVFQPLLTDQFGDVDQGLRRSAWKGLLASFSGGFAEEIQYRLFLMSLLAWLGSYIRRTSDGKPTSGVLWIASALAAVFFGLGHLPSLALHSVLAPIVVTRTLLLNAILGISFGWLYQTRGLESAVIAHFSADIVLHVLLTLVLGALT